METPSNTVRYPMNAQTQFMLCRSCRNHLSTFNNCLGQAFDGLLCRTVDNVRADDIAAPTLLYGLPAVNVHCNGCNTQIGERFISPDNPRFHEHYLFLLDRILYWDGTRGLRDAVTHEPVNEPDNNEPQSSKNESHKAKSREKFKSKDGNIIDEQFVQSLRAFNLPGR